MYDDWNCLLCGGEYCNCNKAKAWKCNCQTAKTNEQLKKVLVVLGIGPAKYNFWRQDAKVREVIKHMKDEYLIKWKMIDAPAVVEKFKEDFPKPEVKEIHRNKSLKCQFNVPFSNALCQHCSRPKRHVDLQWGDCAILVAKYWKNE